MPFPQSEGKVLTQGVPMDSNRRIFRGNHDTNFYLKPQQLVQRCPSVSSKILRNFFMDMAFAVKAGLAHCVCQSRLCTLVLNDLGENITGSSSILLATINIR